MSNNAIFKKYAAYKDSGIEWIGEIPSPWKINKLKYTTYIKGRVGWQALTTNEYVNEGPYLVTGTDFLDGEIEWGKCFHVSQDRYEMDPYIKLKNGDLLITKDGTIGKLAVVKNLPAPATLNSGIFLTRPFQSNVYDERYMFWLLNSSIFSRFIDYMSKGSTISHLYQEVFREFIYPVPSMDEQRAIANYFSAKITQIDDLISKKEYMIELLKEERTAIINQAVTKGLDPNVKMKDSTWQWLGAIPKHWEIKRLKYLVNLINEVGTITGGGIRVDLENIQSWTGRFLQNETLPDEDEEMKQFIIGDVLLNKLRPYLAKVFHAEQNGICGGELLVLRPNKLIHSKFLYYRAISNDFIRVVDGSTYGAKMPRASWDFIGNLLIPYPDINEQFKIVDYLDRKTKQITKQLALEQKSIGLLKEYRTALISEVVTGKIDVRGRA